MNADYEKELEAKIDRELKQLPLLSAPSKLTARVMKVVAARAALPWYRQPWPVWPLPLRAISFVVLLGLFVLTVFGAWQWMHAGPLSTAQATAGGWLAIVETGWETFKVLFGAVVLTFKHLGMGFIVGCVLVVTCSYFACIGLGTVVVRFAVARR